jgi:hypothetical protein
MVLSGFIADSSLSISLGERLRKAISLDKERRMTKMNVADFIDLVRAVAWPVVVVTAVLLLRKSLRSFLEGMGQRATKLSIFQFAVELSEVPEFTPAWSGPYLSDVRQPTPAAEFQSGAMALFEQIRDETASDYAVIDLGEGKKWLTSRLFIFAVMLQRMRGLRCLVFLETSGGVRRRFVGMAPPDVVRWSLAMRYPWLESALAKAYSNELTYNEIRTVHGGVDPHVANQVVMRFLEDIQQAEAPATQDNTKWVTLKDSQGNQTWEHARWLDGARLQRTLGHAIENAWVPDSPNAPADERAKMVLRREGPYVAVVEDGKVFRALIDRHTLVEQVAKDAAELQAEGP